MQLPSPNDLLSLKCRPLVLQTIAAGAPNKHDESIQDAVLTLTPAIGGVLPEVPSTGLVGGGSQDPGTLAQAFSGLGECSRKAIPWREIADWTHGLEKTPTDRWMDLFRGRFHRTFNHHPADFLNAWISQKTPGLHVGDYVRHLALDAITTDGLPMLGSQWHQALEKLGIASKFLHQWTHLNAFDVTFGCLSLGGGGSTLALALTGNLPWEGPRTMILTFGGGVMDLAVGCAFENPLMVAGGAMRVSAGCISLWQHWHMPSIEPAIPTLSDILGPALMHGAEAGAVGGVLRLALGWRAWSTRQRGFAFAESLAVSSSAAALGAISTWLSMPASFAYGLGKFAWRLAGDDTKFWSNTSLTSPSTFTDAMDSLIQNGGPEALASLRAYVERGIIAANALAPSDFAIERAWLDLSEGSRSALACNADMRLGEAARVAVQPRSELFNFPSVGEALAPVSFLPPVSPL